MNLLHLETLCGHKNLLGFSGGVDSSCLFFALIRKGIDFDLAIVNYGVRKSAKDELQYAKKLAKKYHKKIFILHAQKITKNFESEARRVRFAFFERVIWMQGYENLILAHQLNDRFEWLLMQLTKGCGLNSLLGFSSIAKSNFCFLEDVALKKIQLDSQQHYCIIRPLSEISRNEIWAFLKKHKIKYFVDKSNKNEKFKRNYFRKHFGNKLIKNFKSGILKSLRFLDADFNALYGKSRILKMGHIFLIECGTSLNFGLDLHKTNANHLQLLAQIDNIAKKLGYVISQNQRIEIIKSEFSCVVGDKIVIDSTDNFIFMCANDSQNRLKHDKKFREKLRIAKIPPKIRPFVDEAILESLKIQLKPI